MHKTVQNDKKFCLSCSRSQESYIIWLSLMVQMCKYYLQMVFSILKFWFSRLSGGWKTKISVCRSLYFRNQISYDLHLWYTCMFKRIISPGIFFSKFCFLGLLGGIRGGGKRQKITQNDKKLCVSLHIWGTVHHILWFLVHM